VPDLAEAGDGDRAIDMLADSAVFDLLLTDISMPGPTDGNALALRAKRLCPGIPVTYLSGCPDSLTNRVGDRDAFVRKPFGLGEIVAAVRRLAPALQGPEMTD
jgi:CheY-like chemotaxis protein